MLLSLFFDKKIKRGKFTVCANVLLCVTLLTRAVSFGTALYALVLLLSDDVISTVHYSLVNEIKIYGAMPMGQMLKGVIYSTLTILLPLQLSSGLIGFLGYMCKNKVAIIVHFILLCLSMSLLVVYLVLVGGLLREFYFSIKDKFFNEMHNGSTGAAEVQSKLRCCNLTGNSNTCKDSIYTAGCWDIWSHRMHTFCSTLMALYTFSFCLEVINTIITDYRYRELKKNEDVYHKSQYDTRCLRKYLPRDIIGHSCFSIITFIRREGLLEFLCRLLFITIAGLGTSMLAYGAERFHEYLESSSRKINPIMTDNGLNLYSVLRATSGVLFFVGSLMLLGAVFNTFSSCFQSMRVLFAQATILCVGILIKILFLCALVPLYLSIKTCTGVLGENHTFTKATFSFLGVSLFIEILLLSFIDFKVRRFSTRVTQEGNVAETTGKGLFAHFKDLLLERLQRFKKQKEEFDPILHNRRQSLIHRTNVVHPSPHENETRRQSVASNEIQGSENNAKTEGVISNQRRVSENNNGRESVTSNETQWSENSVARESAILNKTQEKSVRKENVISNQRRDSEHNARTESVISNQRGDSEHNTGGESVTSNDTQGSEENAGGEALVNNKLIIIEHKANESGTDWHGQTDSENREMDI